jgi:AcrR family transcriptional regulator
MASNRRLGVEDSKSRALLIEAAGQILEEEGYHAISARRVAERAGLKPQLVHYYFRTMDDLLIAAFRRATAQYLELHEQALTASQPLKALWTLNTNRSDTKITMEFIAAGSHREELRAEIVRSGEHFRTLQIAMVDRALKQSGIDGRFSAPAIVMLMAAISRALVMESTLGLTLAHDDIHAMAREFLDAIEPPAR